MALRWPPGLYPFRQLVATAVYLGAYSIFRRTLWGYCLVWASASFVAWSVGPLVVHYARKVVSSAWIPMGTAAIACAGGIALVAPLAALVQYHWMRRVEVSNYLGLLLNDRELYVGT